LPIGRASYLAPYLVLDESDDPGFKLKRRVNGLFVAALVPFRDPEQARATQAYEFKFNTCRDEIRDAFDCVIRFGASAMVAKKKSWPRSSPIMSQALAHRRKLLLKKVKSRIF
jgi:hypothetical protein